MNSQIIFKSIRGYEGLYKINNLGVVICLPKKQNKFLTTVLKPHIDKKGYYRIRLCKNSKYKNFYIARLVAETYIPNPLNKPQVNHIDGNKLNNLIDNLEWVSCKENVIHAYRNGLNSCEGEKNSQHKLTKNQVLKIRMSKLKYKEIAIIFNIKPSTVAGIKKFQRWKNVI